MESFNRSHQRNIRLIFEEKTGANLSPKRKVSTRRGWKIACVAAVLTMVMATMVSCTHMVFSPLRGDALALSGSYLGGGIVEVTVTNGSDKSLRLQKKVKLVSWSTGDAERTPHGKVSFEGNTEIAPNSSETIRIDLNDAYDIPALEQAVNPRYYLLLTNQDFLFGQDWMCSFTFREEEPTAPTATEENIHVGFRVEPEILENIDPALRYYFEDSYQDELPAFNPVHFAYQDQVREWLLRQKGRLVHPVDPWLKLGDVPENVVFDESVPEQWRQSQVVDEYSSVDGFGRIVGSSFGGVGSDFVLKLSALVPCEPGQYNTGAYLPLVYMATFAKSEIQSPEDHAYLYGQLLTFGELERYKVFENEKYAVYEVTDLFYRDLDGYLDDFLQIRPDVYLDETIRRRLHAVYDFYRDADTLPDQFVYFETPTHAAPMVPAAQ